MTVQYKFNNNTRSLPKYSYFKLFLCLLRTDSRCRMNEVNLQRGNLGRPTTTWSYCNRSTRVAATGPGHRAAVTGPVVLPGRLGNSHPKPVKTSPKLTQHAVCS